MHVRVRLYVGTSIAYERYVDPTQPPEVDRALVALSVAAERAHDDGRPWLAEYVHRDTLLRYGDDHARMDDPRAVQIGGETLWIEDNHGNGCAADIVNAWDRITNAWAN